MRELGGWGVLHLPNTDFSSHFTRVQEANANGKHARSGEDCRGAAFLIHTKRIVHGGDNNSKGSCAVHLHGAVVLICLSTLCNAHHLQALYASATQNTPSAPFNDFCLMNFSVFIKGDAVTRDSLKHTHLYNLYQAPSHNHSGSAPNIAQALQNQGVRWQPASDSFINCNSDAAGLIKYVAVNQPLKTEASTGELPE